MKFLLDTCALLWTATDPNKLSASARTSIEDLNNTLCVSAISAFEIGLLQLRQRIRLADEPEAWLGNAITKFGLTIQPIFWHVAMRSARLPAIHRDPVDRIIVATAREIEAAIVTPDLHIAQYPDVQVIW